MKRFHAVTMASLAAFAMNAAAQEMLEGYTCCNLHYDKDRISDANWRRAAMIPAGAKIKVTEYGSNKANVEIDGRPFVIVQDYGRKEESLQQLMQKIVVKGNPQAKIARYPEKIRQAIHEGMVIPGMNREQVIISVGYPPTHKTASLESNVWNHWASRAGRYEVHWAGNGTVDHVVGTP